MSHNMDHPSSPSTPSTFAGTKVDLAMDLPEFPLIPASRGFCITLGKTLEMFRKTVTQAGISLE